MTLAAYSSLGECFGRPETDLLGLHSVKAVAKPGAGSLQAPIYNISMVGPTGFEPSPEALGHSRKSLLMPTNKGFAAG